MRAYVLAESNSAARPWQPTERPYPVAGPGEVVIRVKAVSLNYRDLIVAKGSYGGNVKPQLIPVSDGAGEIMAVGEGVGDLLVGDRVVAAFSPTWLSGPPMDRYRATALGGTIDGMLAEQVVLKASGVVKFPSYLSFEEAATLPCAAVTAWHALMETGPAPKPGSTVLTLGTGGVSIFAIQLALAAGLRVIATTRSDTKKARLQAMGVTDVIHTQTTPNWQVEAKRLTGGEGVDRVIEVGGAATLTRSLEALKVGGTVSLIGILAGMEHNFNPMLILQRNAQLHGVTVGSVAMLEDLNRALVTNRIHPVIEKVYDFDQANAALEHLASGTHFGKIVVLVS